MIDKCACEENCNCNTYHKSEFPELLIPFKEEDYQLVLVPQCCTENPELCESCQ